MLKRVQTSERRSDNEGKLPKRRLLTPARDQIVKKMGSNLFFQPGKNGHFPVRQGACEANYTYRCYISNFMKIVR